MSDNNYSLLSNYEFKKDIGEGNFGKVKLAIFKPTGEEFAIKILNKKLIKKKMKNITFKENEIILKFNHINIVYVYELIEEKENYYIVMEYCKLGDLFDYIVSKKRLSENEASIFFYQLINGVDYIHKLGYAHRDLKPENLLLCKNKILKIIDFGLSREYNEEELLITKCGSPSYAPPELIMGRPYDAFKTDIWSCGIILYGMLCGYLPFDGDDTNELFMEILECNPEYPFMLSDSSIGLIQSMLQFDPDDRITIDEIKESDIYLKGKKLCKIDYNSLNDFLNQRDLIYRKNQSLDKSRNKIITIESNDSIKDFGDKKRIKLFFENSHFKEKDNKIGLSFGDNLTKLNSEKINSSAKDSIYLKTTDNNRNIINTFRQKIINKPNKKNKNFHGPPIISANNNLSPKKKNNLIDDLKVNYNTQKTNDNNEKNSYLDNNQNCNSIGKIVDNKLFNDPEKKLKETFNLNINEHNNKQKISFSVNKRSKLNIEKNNFFNLKNKIHNVKLKFNNINIKTKNNNIPNANIQARNNNNINQNNYSYNNLLNDFGKKKGKNRLFLSPQNYNKQELQKNNNKNIVLKINKLNVDTVINQINNKKRQVPCSPMNSINSNKIYLNSLLLTSSDNDRIFEHEKKNNDINEKYNYDKRIIGQIAKGIISPSRNSKYIKFNGNKIGDNNEDNYNNAKKNRGKINSCKKNIKRAHEKLKLNIKNIKSNNNENQLAMIHCNSEKSNNYFPLIEG